MDPVLTFGKDGIMRLKMWPHHFSNMRHLGLVLQNMLRGVIWFYWRSTQGREGNGYYFRLRSVCMCVLTVLLSLSLYKPLIHWCFFIGFSCIFLSLVLGVKNNNNYGSVTYSVNMENISENSCDWIKCSFLLKVFGLEVITVLSCC